MPIPRSTSPAPSPDLDDEQHLEAMAPGFLQPASPRPSDPLDLEQSRVTPPETDSELEEDELDAWPEYSELDEPDDATSSRNAQPPTSSPASTADPSLFVDLTRTAVGIASLGIGWLRARQRHAPAIAGAWIADEQDQAAIGDPLARIAARRVPAVAGAANPDVADGIEAVMGTVNYGLRHFDAEAQMLAAGITHLTDEETTE